MPHKDRGERNAYMRKYVLDRYYDRREEALKFLGSKCVRCGTTNDLQFDHIDRDSKLFSIGKLWSISLDQFWIEVKKCQLLCFNCHIEKTNEVQDWRPKGA